MSKLLNVFLILIKFRLNSKGSNVFPAGFFIIISAILLRKQRRVESVLDLSGKKETNRKN